MNNERITKRRDVIAYVELNNSVANIILDLQKLLDEHGDTLALEVTVYDDEYDLNLYTYLPETDEEMIGRIERAAEHEKRTKEYRRKQFERLKKEFSDEQD